MNRAIFLDRDGVINKAHIKNGKPFSPSSPTELEIFDDIQLCISKLKKIGFVIAVLTNQPDIARGRISLKMVETIHDIIKDKTTISHFFICPHDDLDFCNCRKPKIGLLLQAALDLDIDLKQSFMIGDRWKDIQAGQNAGCRCFFINNDYSEEKPKLPYIEIKSLTEATNLIIEEFV